MTLKARWEIGGNTVLIAVNAAAAVPELVALGRLRTRSPRLAAYVRTTLLGGALAHLVWVVRDAVALAAVLRGDNSLGLMVFEMLALGLASCLSLIHI